MNKDLIILLQNSMAHATQIHLRNDEKINVDDVVDTAIKIAERLFETATIEEARQPGQRRK